MDSQYRGDSQTSLRSENRERVVYSSEYSDNFDSDVEETQTKPGHQNSKRRTAPNGVAKKGAEHSFGAKKRLTKENSNRTSQSTNSPRQLDSVARKMLSAKQRRLNNFRNDIVTMQKEIEDLQLENKTIKRQNRLMEKDLVKFDGRDAELPNLISRHNEEVRSFRDQLRRTREKYKRVQTDYQEKAIEVDRLKKQLKRLKELSEDKNLVERDALARKCTQLDEENDEKTQKIQDLEKKIEILQKNHRHEISIEMHRHKETKKQNQLLEVRIGELETRLKEKEKQLDIKNIYSQRVIRAPHFISNPSPLQQINLMEETKSRSKRSAQHNRKDAASPQPSKVDAEINFVNSETVAQVEEVEIQREADDERIDKAMQRREAERLEQLQREEEERRFQQQREAEELENLERKRLRDIAEAEEQRRFMKEEAERLLREAQERKLKDNLLAKMFEETKPVAPIVKESIDEKDDIETKAAIFLSPKHQIMDFNDDSDSIPEIPTLSLEPRHESDMSSKNHEVKKSTKNYKFTEQVENLHAGKPATMVKFNGSPEAQSTYAGSQSSLKQNSASPNGYDDENENFGNTRNVENTRQLINHNNKLLYRRGSQTRTTFAKPVINSVDDVDDLEEVIL